MESLRLIAPLVVVLAAACGSTVEGGSGGSSPTSGIGGAAPTTSLPTTSTVGTGGTSTSSTSSDTFNTGGTGGVATTGGTRPPAAGPPIAPDGTSTAVYAVNRIYLGDTDPDGTPDKLNGWKSFGFDIDNRISVATSTDLCMPVSNAAPKNVYPDGNNGIDNSFGKNILPILLGLSSDTSVKVNDAFATGKLSLLFAIDELGAGASYNPLSARFYQAGDLGHTPHDDGTDAWPVKPESLSVPNDVSSAKLTFSQSYLIGNTWVGQGQGLLPVDLAIGGAGGFGITFDVQNPIVTMVLSPDHKTASHGTIAGVISTAAFIAKIKQLAGTFDPSLCSGATIDSITQQIAQASDILHDGTQDPSKACDGISVGLGFDANVAQLGPIAPPAPPPPNPCGP